MNLSKAQTKVYILASKGLTNKQIAAALKIKLCTVKFHLSNIYKIVGKIKRAQFPALGSELTAELLDLPKGESNVS